MFWEIRLYNSLPHVRTLLPIILPPPESLQTGDILCCICFEIISYNRWVLFPEPASQPHIAPRALVAVKIWKATHASRMVQFSSQCPPMLCHQTHLSTRMGVSSHKIPLGVCFSFPLFIWSVNACLHCGQSKIWGYDVSGCSNRWATIWMYNIEKGRRPAEERQSELYGSRYVSSVLLNSFVFYICFLIKPKRISYF